MYRRAYTRGMKETTALRLDRTLLAAMRRVRQTEGVPVTTQIEMAVRAWLEKRGTLAAPRRVSTRHSKKGGA